MFCARAMRFIGPIGRFLPVPEQVPRGGILFDDRVSRLSVDEELSR